MEEHPNSPQNQDSDQIDPTKDQHFAAQHSAKPPLAPVHVSGPTQWAPIQQFLVQGPWNIGSNQTWAPYGTSGEEGNVGIRMGWTGPGPRPKPILQGSGVNPYPTIAPSFVPYPIPANGGRPELGDPLYTSPGDGPEPKLITYSSVDPKTTVLGLKISDGLDHKR